jgi:hypothetical protein
MRREPREPRLAKTLVDHVEKCPHGALRRPRIIVGLDPRSGRDRAADQTSGKRELDVGAHAIGAVRADAEPGREPLGEPALHPARRYGDHLWRERVGRRLGQDRGERICESISPFGAV